MGHQEIARACQLEILLAEMLPTRQAQILLSVSRLANERFQEERSFEPPVSEQLRIKRRNDDRVKIERAEFVQVLAADLEKMGRVFFGDGCGESGLVKLLLSIVSGDPVIFYAG